MNRVEPEDYINYIMAKFNIGNIFKLNKEVINEQPREFEREVEIAKLFIPKLANVGIYDARYDLAAAMVTMLGPFDQRTKMLSNVCEHYKIHEFYPYDIVANVDFYESNGIYYHPGYPINLFAHPALQITKFEECSALLFALRTFKDQAPSPDLYMRMLYYYGWKMGEIRITRTQIKLISAFLPFFPHTMEEVNAALKDIYDGGPTAVNRPKSTNELAEKLQKDYRTVIRHWELLALSERFRTVLWVDNHYLHMETLNIVIPDDYNIHIKTQYAHQEYNLRGAGDKVTQIGIPIPLNLVSSFLGYLQHILNVPFKIYKAYSIPMINYNFNFYNREKKAMVINWQEVADHFKNCAPEHDLQGGKEYVPLRVRPGKIDTLTLKIHAYLSTNADLMNNYLIKMCNTTAPNISTRRRQLEQAGLIFPFIYNPYCPETYLWKIHTTKIDDINYIIQLLTIFPCTYYIWYENLKVLGDKFFEAWIALPIGSYDFLKDLAASGLRLPNELYYIAMRVFMPTLLHWQLYDDQTATYKFDFNNIQF